MDGLLAKHEEIARRVQKLEDLVMAYEASQRKSSFSKAPSQTQIILTEELKERGLSDFKFCRVPADYYERDLEYRRQCLNAPSVDHLCKTIVFENTRAHPSVAGCENPSNSKYYCVIVQYTARFHSEKLKRHIHKLNEGIGIRFFNMRLAPDDVAQQLTGYGHNAVVPVGLKTPIPIVISDRITALDPPVFWMGGGEVDLKLMVGTSEFVLAYAPMVVDCTYNGDEA
eukprot:jgi/Botrbrau1/8480/Bobra.0237s0096.1